MVATRERIAVRVTPKASADRIVEEEGMLRVYVTAVPEDGKANKAVIALLAKHFGIAKSRLEVVQGISARDKVIVVS